MAAVRSVSCEPVGRVRTRVRAILTGFLRGCWDWVAVGLFPLVTVDVLTTTFVAVVLGPEAEANPLMRRALRRGPPTLVATKVSAVVLTVGFFYALR